MVYIKFRKCLAVLIGLALTATGLWAGAASEEEPAAAAEKEMVRDPATGKIVTAPEYGGTITYGRSGKTGEHSDAWFIGGWATHYISLVNEKLGIGNWAIDRNEFDWRSLFMPEFAVTGLLAESWEQPDPLTYIFHIRQGVNFHDKPPVNGRELTAKDIEYNFHRILGLGSGFSEASPALGTLAWVKFESVTATDTWTVVIKLKELNLNALINMLQWADGIVIYPPEVIEQHGDVKDWRNVVGTGPFELTDLVEGSSITWTKNPDYWRYDEKYPQNRLPYVDEIIALLMREEATRLAALRAGRIDMLGSVGDSALTSIDQVESLEQTNPEIDLWPFKFRGGNSFIFVNVNAPPWNDIRVRQAMQMALDLETINNTFFKGYGDATPNGRIANNVKGMGTPFEEWPEELKKVYDYDPEGAEALLDAAGYPRGADGIRIKTSIAQGDWEDPSYAEIVAEYWRDIGVEIAIDAMDITRLHGAAGPDQTTYRLRGYAMAIRYYPVPMLGEWTTEIESPWAPSGFSVPEFDALFQAASAASTFEEQNRSAKEANMLLLEHQTVVWGPEVPHFTATQPWVKGYNGEIRIGHGQQSQNVLTRLWIDSEMKEAMGH